MPAGANPDLFVLTLPLSLQYEGLAILAFIGGFSSATSMVIVAAIALSTMVSNNIVLPFWLSLKRGPMMSGDVRRLVLRTRRVAIAGILALGYFYYRVSGGGAALASIGLISFAGVAQVLPAMMGAMFWRGATRIGAGAGLAAGFLIWAYCLLLPSFGTDVVMSAKLLSEGPFGLTWLRPQAFFGVEGIDPLVHAVFWSMIFNAGAFILGSFLSFPLPLERLQGVQFVQVWEQIPPTTGSASPQSVAAEDLLVMAQRILGAAEAQELFAAEAKKQGREGILPDATHEFIELLERELAGSVGAATSHAMLGQLITGARTTVEDLMRVADEAAQIMEYSNQLEVKSVELERAMRQLRDANHKLTQLSEQKDAFLSQISHELRTPMTSIRSFSEILMEGDMLSAGERTRFSQIIRDESARLTRLLDDLLDLSVLENGRVALSFETVRLGELIDGAIDAVNPVTPLVIRREPAREGVAISSDRDRLLQVLINIIGNAKKYCDATQPELRISVQTSGPDVLIDLVDNGTGIPAASQTMIFEKFARLSDHAKAGGAGLGLAICREIMLNLGGSVSYLPGQGGAAFRIRMPVLQGVSA